jgi:uncharacterized protein (TIGR02588 family)
MAGKRHSARTADLVEWGLGILSAVLVLALCGYLAYEALTGSATLPVLEAELVPAAPGEAPDQLRFVVRNTGGHTATAVSLALVLYDEAGEPAGERRIVLDYLPGHSEATGGFILPPGGERLRPELVVEGYLDP